MKLSDFDFDLPDELIALRPVRPRPASRLLVARGPGTEDAAIEDAHVRDLARFLAPGDLLVFNDTKVIPARLFGERHRETTDGSGIAKIEATLIERTGDATWRALAKPAKRLRTGDADTRLDAFKQLRTMGDRATPMLKRMLRDADPEMRFYALQLLNQANGELLRGLRGVLEHAAATGDGGEWYPAMAVAG